MSPVLAGVLQLLALVAALALAYRPLGDYMAAVYSSPKHLRVEKLDLPLHRRRPATPRCAGPPICARVLAFSAVGVLFLYLLQRVQGGLPLSLGFTSIDPDQAFNTAASFVANTNWQSYAANRPWATSCRPPASRCRTSSRPPSAWPSPSRWCAASPGPGPASWATSGPTWCAAPSASCSRSPSSARSCWSPRARSRTSPASTRSASSCGGTQQIQRRRAWPPRRSSRSWAPTGAATSTPTPPTRSRTPTASRNLFEVFLILVIPFALTRTFGKLVGNVQAGLRDPRRDGRSSGSASPR